MHSGHARVGGVACVARREQVGRDLTLENLTGGAGGFLVQPPPHSGGSHGTLSGREGGAVCTGRQAREEIPELA